MRFRERLLGASPKVLLIQTVGAFRANVGRSLVISLIVAACAAASFFETYVSANDARAEEAIERLAGRDVVRIEGSELPTRACLDLMRIDGIESTVAVRHLGSVVIGTPASREVTVEALAGPVDEFFHLPAGAAVQPAILGGDLSESISEGATSQTLLLPRVSAASPSAQNSVRVPMVLEAAAFPPMGRSFGSSVVVAAPPDGRSDVCLVALNPPVDDQAPAMLQGLIGAAATVNSVVWQRSARATVSPQERYRQRIGRYAPFALVLVVGLVDLLNVRSRRREFALYRVNGVNGFGILFMRLVESALLAAAAVVGWTLSLTAFGLVDAGSVDLPAARLGVENALSFVLLMLGAVPILGALTLQASPWSMLREP